MSAQELRKVLLRVVLDGDFTNSLRANPEAALQGYVLTDDEKVALTNPTADLLNKLGPVDEGWLPPPIQITFTLLFEPPPPPDEVSMMTEAGEEQALRLVKNIRSYVGAERFDAIKDLVRQTQPGGQSSGKPAGNE